MRMRLFAILLIFMFSVQADEVKRLDAMVEDIASLQESSDAYKKEASKQQQENKALKEQIASQKETQQTTDVKSEKEPFRSEIDALKKEIENSKKLLSRKDKEIEKLNAKLISQQAPENEIPKLVMKEENTTTTDSLTYFQPTTYRLKKDSYIYDGINGKKMAVWEKDTSFTTYIRKDNWVKVTGYFVDRVWVSSKQQNMWVQVDSIKPH